jgi:hypothetical protein
VDLNGRIYQPPRYDGSHLDCAKPGMVLDRNITGVQTKVLRTIVAGKTVLESKEAGRASSPHAGLSRTTSEMQIRIE